MLKLDLRQGQKKTPSQVFKGETDSNSFVFPNRVPPKYAEDSLVQRNNNVAKRYVDSYSPLSNTIKFKREIGIEIYSIPKKVTETFDRVCLFFELYNAERHIIGKMGTNKKWMPHIIFLLEYK